MELRNRCLILAFLVIGHTLAITSILVPLYIYPSPGAWNPLFRVIKDYPRQPFTIIINPSSGPGEGALPDASYITEIKKLNHAPNVRLIGYTHTDYTSRPLTDVYADIDTYASWSSYPSANIKLSGVFIDESPADVGSEGRNMRYMASLQKRVKQSFGPNGFTMTNPGTITDKRFYSFADSIVSYEDPFASYYDEGTLQTSSDPSKSPGTPCNMQGIIATHFTGSETREKYLLSKVVQRGIGHVYFTRDPDYLKFGTDLVIMVDEVARRNGFFRR